MSTLGACRMARLDGAARRRARRKATDLLTIGDDGNVVAPWKQRLRLEDGVELRPTTCRSTSGRSARPRSADISGGTSGGMEHDCMSSRKRAPAFRLVSACDESHPRRWRSAQLRSSSPEHAIGTRLPIRGRFSRAADTSTSRLVAAAHMKPIARCTAHSMTGSFARKCRKRIGHEVGGTPSDTRSGACSPSCPVHVADLTGVGDARDSGRFRSRCRRSD